MATTGRLINDKFPNVNSLAAGRARPREGKPFQNSHFWVTLALSDATG